jgi:pimeloyl-ACP methyl ester carboxylesterase
LTPFFFHTAAQPLFGLYAPPQGPQDRDEGILLCAPVAHEYMRAHWCLRLLAADLLQAGFHVFRFDWSCLGDSWGSFEEATVPRWVEDVRVAVQELADNSGVRKLSVVGLRLGATLACAAADLPLHQLILWEPVPNGRAHLEQLRCMQTQIAEARHNPPAPDFADLLGYRYSAALVEQLKQLNLNAAPLPKANRVCLLLAAPDPAALQLQKRLDEHSIATEVRFTKETAGWDQAADFAEQVLLPGARRAVVELLGGAGA